METKQRILMVEDEAAILLAVSDYLSHLGYEVDGVSDIDCAREKLAEHEYAAVISDLRLTGSDANEGLQLATEIRARESNTGVILLTAYGSAELEQAAREQGVVAFLHKPKPLGELAQIVYSILSERSEPNAPLLSRPATASKPGPRRILPGQLRRFQLTDEELEVARLVGEGHSNRDIAAAMAISEEQVAAHRDTLAVRLDARSRFELALYLVRQGVIG